MSDHRNTDFASVKKQQSINKSASVVLEDEIDFIELIKILKQSRITLLLVAVISFALASAYAFMSVDLFRAETVLLPAESSGSGASLGGQLGQAASFVGINIGDENRQIDYALAALRSRELIVNYIHKQGIAVPLMAGNWNKQENQSKINPQYYNLQTASWQGKFAPNGPSDWQLFNAFYGLLTITEDRQSSIIRVAIEWIDPVLASEWVNGIVDEVNEIVKARDLAEAMRAIVFSRAQLEATQLVDMQKIFYGIIEEQTKVVLLADVRDEYVFQVVDRAVVAEEKIAPRRTLIMLAGLFVGFILGILFVLFKHYFNYRSTEKLGDHAR